MPPHSVSLPPAFLFLSLLVFFLSFRLKNREGDTGCADTNQELSTDGNSNMTLIVSPGKQVSPSVGGTDNVASKSVAVWQKNSEEVIQNHGKIFISSCLQNMQSERWKFSPISGSLDWDGNLPVQLLNIKRSQIYPTNRCQQRYKMWPKNRYFFTEKVNNICQQRPWGGRTPLHHWPHQ